MKMFSLFFFFLISSLFTSIEGYAQQRDGSLNENVKINRGTPFSSREMQIIFNRTKALVIRHEGVVYEAYNLCKRDKHGKIKQIYDKIANRLVEACEYQQNYRKRIYKSQIIKNRKNVHILYTPVKLYTACYGNTMILNSNGNFLRFIKPFEKFTKEQCDKMFKDQFEVYKRFLYQNMTDAEGVNWFNSMMLNEVVVMIDITWHNGKSGSKKTSAAMINFVKYRTKAAYNKLIQSINKDLKQSKHYNNFKNRRENYKKLLSGEMEEI